MPTPKESLGSVSPANQRHAPEVIVQQTTIGTMGTMDENKQLASMKTEMEETGGANLGQMLGTQKMSIDLQKMHTTAAGAVKN